MHLVAVSKKAIFLTRDFPRLNLVLNTIILITGITEKDLFANESLAALMTVMANYTLM